MKPDFKLMSKSELRAYVLKHRGDREAFYNLVDRLKDDNQNTQWNPFPQTPEDLAAIEEAIHNQIRKIEES
ncbi:DUF6887 family protein [Phormidesmis sp. 146-12]